jgi:hypothetical protein
MMPYLPWCLEGDGVRVFARVCMGEGGQGVYVGGGKGVRVCVYLGGRGESKCFL